MFRPFNFNRNAKKANTVQQKTACEYKTGEVTTPIYTVENITSDEVIQRCLDILNGDVVPTMGDWQELRNESGEIWNRMAFIKRNIKDEEQAKMPWGIWVSEVAYKAAVVEHLVVMAFRKAWYVNQPEEAKQDARHDLVYIGEDSSICFGHEYRKRHKDYGFPAIRDVAYLDLRNDFKPYTNWI